MIVERYIAENVAMGNTTGRDAIGEFVSDVCKKISELAKKVSDYFEKCNIKGQISNCDDKIAKFTQKAKDLTNELADPNLDKNAQEEVEGKNQETITKQPRDSAMVGNELANNKRWIEEEEDKKKVLLMQL
jgi:hypothetical protein